MIVGKLLLLAFVAPDVVSAARSSKGTKTNPRSLNDRLLAEEAAAKAAPLQETKEVTSNVSVADKTVKAQRAVWNYIFRCSIQRNLLWLHHLMEPEFRQELLEKQEEKKKQAAEYAQFRMTAAEVEVAAAECAMNHTSEACRKLQLHFKAIEHEKEPERRLISTDPPVPSPADTVATLAPTKDDCYGNHKDHRFCASEMPSNSVEPSAMPVYGGTAEPTTEPTLSIVTAVPTTGAPVAATAVPSIGIAPSVSTEPPTASRTVTGAPSVSYTHLTLPTILRVYISSPRLL